MKKIFVKFDLNFICRKLLQDKLESLGLEYSISGRGEVIFDNKLTEDQYLLLETSLMENGMELVKNNNSQLVQRIKDAISSLFETENIGQYKLSTFLSEKLHYSYAHLSNVFSEETYTSIENFMILKKIDHAKHLLLNERLTLTEIAYKLNYSSVSHLSSQFKKTTGLTPTTFQRLMNNRNRKQLLQPKKA